MDNNAVLKINVDGSPFIEGQQPKRQPVTHTVTLQGDRPSNTLSTEEIQKRREEKKNKQGQFAWSLLHGYRGCDPQWLELWVYFIPQRCDCKDGYQKILETLPADFTSPEAFFAWGVRLHNAVNEKLGKPQITLDEALTIWRKTDDGREKENQCQTIP
jgi:hypothetical protein